MLKCTFCIGVSLLLFLPIVNWLYATHQVLPEARAQAAELFVNPTECRPEPAERLAFMAGLLLVPAAVMALSYGIHRRHGPNVLEDHWLVGIVCASLFLVIGCYGFVEQQFFHIRQSVFVREPLIAVLLFLGTLVVIWKQWVAGRLVHALAIALILVVGLACIFDEGGSYSGNWHFAAAFNSVVQVHLGKALLVDCRAQYGLYAHFLEPIFAVTGLSVLTFTIVMAALLAVAYLAIWRVMNSCIRNKVVTVVGFFALVFTSWFYLRFSKDGRFQWVDQYFQYHPIRFLFPAISVWLTWNYIRNPGRRLYWISMAVLSAGVLWNFDAGLPAFLAWLAAVAFADLFQCSMAATAKRAIGHAVAAGAMFTMIVAGYSFVVFLRYGAFPDFSEFFRYQKLFYVSGFFMLPMPWPGTWTLVVSTYLLGLAYTAGILSRAVATRTSVIRNRQATRQPARSFTENVDTPIFTPEPEAVMRGANQASALVQNRTAARRRISFLQTIMARRPSAMSSWTVLSAGRSANPPTMGVPSLNDSSDVNESAIRKAQLVFFLSILGLGLFSYYQGRSHEYVLTLVWWPCFILLAIFMDTMLAAWRSGTKSLLGAIVFLSVAWLLTGYAWSAVADLGCMTNLIHDQFPRSDRPHAMDIRYEAKLLRDHFADQGQALLLSPSEPVLHLLTGIPALAPCSYIEMVLVDDYAEVLQRLAGRPNTKIYIDKNVFRYHWKRVGSRQLIDGIQKDFVLAAETPMGLIFERGDLCLKTDARPLCHTGFKDGKFPQAMEFAPIRIERDFAIELIVNPDQVNRPWRVILSNHCGSPHRKGMMIFESHPNLYELVCGTGAEWHHAAKLHIPPGVWSYVAISVSRDSVRIFRDGELVDAQPVDGWRLNNGQTLLILGDWLNHDCPFHGRIREVRILDRALSEQEIVENCGRFKSLQMR